MQLSGHLVLFVNRCEDSSSRDWFPILGRMCCGWIVEAAPHFRLQFVFLLRSLGVALFWNGKDYWCSKAICAIYFQTVGKASVIISILTWCCTRIHDILVCCTSVRSHCIQQVSTNQMIAYELLGLSILNDRSVSVFWNAKFSLTDLYWLSVMS